MFGKEQPGRVRCFGRSVTKSSLQKDEEIGKIKQHAEEKMTSLESELKETQTELKETKTELQETKDKIQGLEDLLRLFLQQNSPGLNIDEALALVRSRQSSPLDANSARDPISQHRHSSTSTHVPNED